MKKYQFINKQALREFNDLPLVVQKRFAGDLNMICKGNKPFSRIKRLTESVGPGAIELVENGRPAYRTIYVAKFNDVVYILFSFTKTTNSVDRKAMDSAKKRYKLMIKEIG